MESWTQRSYVGRDRRCRTGGPDGLSRLMLAEMEFLPLRRFGLSLKARLSDPHRSVHCGKDILMAATPIPRTRLNDPAVLFTEDIMDDPEAAPQLSDPERVPVLEIHLRGTTQGAPDIVTLRTEAHITGWREKYRERE